MQSAPAPRPLLLTWLCALLALLVTFGPVAAFAAPAATRLAGAPATAAVLAPQSRAAATEQSAVVQQAFDLVMDHYVHPLDSADLLGAAWAHLQTVAGEQGVAAPGEAPALTGDRAEDIAALRAALEAYVSDAGDLPESFVPAHVVVRGMAEFVDEGHTYFLPPREYQEHLAWARGEVTYAGIGARMRGPTLTVSEVFDDSPAAQAGLRAGDVIVSVDGVSLADAPLDRGVSLIRGPEGTIVTLEVQRPGVADPITLHVTRARITVQFVSHRLLEEGLGYVSLRGFPEPSVVDRIDRAVEQLRADGALALVMDLRGNSGGRLDVGTRLLSRFLPAGANLYQQLDRSGSHQTRAARHGERYGLPVVVLVDEGTASMGELFAAALKDHQAAAVLGATTSGNVAAGQVFPLDDGSALQITVMELLSANGHSLNRVGLEPNELIEVDLAATPPGEDPVLARAVELLRETLATALPDPAESRFGHFRPL